MKESAFCVGGLVKTSYRIGLIYVLWGVANVVKKCEEKILYDMVDYDV